MRDPAPPPPRNAPRAPRDGVEWGDDPEHDHATAAFDEVCAGAADGRPATAVVIDAPHVGTRWPKGERPPAINFALNADHAVDRLFAPLAREANHRMIRAQVSRAYIDLNRAVDDVSAGLVPDHPAPRPRVSPAGKLLPPRERARLRRPGGDVVWTHSLEGTHLIEPPMAYAELCGRIDGFHRPYHDELTRALDERVATFGRAALIDAHSMPATVFADVVVGTLHGASCPRDLAEAIRDAIQEPLASLGGVVTIDAPYAGGELLRRHAAPSRGRVAIQLEINRRLYLQLDRSGRPLHVHLTPRGTLARPVPRETELRLEALQRGLDAAVRVIHTWTRAPASRESSPSR